VSLDEGMMKILFRGDILVFTAWFEYSWCFLLTFFFILTVEQVLTRGFDHLEEL
jgi:hypothetical protein